MPLSTHVSHTCRVQEARLNAHVVHHCTLCARRAPPRFESSHWVSNFERQLSTNDEQRWGQGPPVNLTSQGWPRALDPRQRIGKLLARNVQLRVPAGV
jgi:hypothetical protein